MSCSATKKDGSPCSARAREGSSFCSFHDPEKARLFELGRQVGAKEGGKGAKEKAKQAKETQISKPAEFLESEPEQPSPPPEAPSDAPKELPPLPVDTALDVVAAAKDTLNRVRSGALTPKEGAAIGSLLSVALQGLKRVEEDKEEKAERPLKEVTLERLREMERAAAVTADKH